MTRPRRTADPELDAQAKGDTVKHWTDKLVAVNACGPAVAWAKEYKTAAAAWKACHRGDWMLWIAGRLAGSSESASRRKVVLAACECARLALRHVKKGEDRPRLAIETAERWARKEPGVTLADVRSAADAADAAAGAAYGADAAAAAAASVAGAARAATYAAAAAAAAADDARTKVLAQCADIVRQHYPRPPSKGS
jgi:hypothetical protein